MPQIIIYKNRMNRSFLSYLCPTREYFNNINSLYTF